MKARPATARAVAPWLAALWLFALPAHAQNVAPSAALHATWLGTWKPAQSNQIAAMPAEFTIKTAAGASRLEAAQASCALRYDGTVSRQELDQRVRDLRDRQLDAAHWPPGTDTAQLVGLKREFDEAQRLIALIAPDNYRRVRAQGAGCDGPGDRLYVLYGGRTLYDLRFPADSVGLTVTVYERSR